MSDVPNQPDPDQPDDDGDEDGTDTDDGTDAGGQGDEQPTG